MATIYTVHGPFDLDKESLKDGKRALKVFWEQDDVSNLQARKGVYAFGVRSGGGITPYYVGKATKTFRGECFQPDKLHKYVVALGHYNKGTPVMFFLARSGPGAIKAAQVNEIESYLISVGWQKNQSIRNIKGIGEPDWKIQGVVRSGQGRRHAAATSFRSMMGL